MKFYYTNIVRFTFLFCILFCINGQAQTSTSSPYSRFGMGLMEPASLSSNTGLGGCYTAYMNDTLVPMFINPGNPASYSTNRLTTFEIGARVASTNFISSQGAVRKNTAGFNYIALAVPLKRRMGLAAGLMPFSNVGYNASNSANVDSIGQVTYNYQGTGGLNKAFLGLAIRPFDKVLRRYHNTNGYRSLYDSACALKIYPYKKDSIEIDEDSIVNMLRREDGELIKKVSQNDDSTHTVRYYQYINNDSVLLAITHPKHHADAIIRRNRFWRYALSSLSIGSNAGYLYGDIQYLSYAYFPFQYGITFNTKQITEMRVRDFYSEAGMQMAFNIYYLGKHKLKKDVKLSLGYSVSVPKNISAQVSQLAYTFSSQSSGMEQPFDTFYNQALTKGTIYLPLIQSLGLGIKRGDNLTVLFDVGMQQWSQYKFFGMNQNTMRDAYNFNIGVLYVPQRNAVGSLSYLKKINYRIGARYNSGNLVFNNTPISTYAVTAGVGLPSGGGRFRLFTMLNISAEYGVNGTQVNGLIQEKYIRFAIGFTFNDRWFIKSRYD
ncbi:MAG: hypothetical protein JST67_06880 [Bacteroidetes bacterium]|nr:hypothetical protein [Bacteroidota bacterium]